MEPSKFLQMTTPGVTLTQDRRFMKTREPKGSELGLITKQI